MKCTALGYRQLNIVKAIYTSLHTDYCNTFNFSWLQLYRSWTSTYIRRWEVSFLILIGPNSVAEWLIVVNTYHLNSDSKWPTLLIPMSVCLWLQTVLHTNCRLCLPPSLTFMISLILSQKLSINSILEHLFTAALWILVIKWIGNHKVKVDLFMHSSCIEYFVIKAKLMNLNESDLIGVTQWKASSQLPICLL